MLIYVVLFMHDKHAGSDEIDNDLNFACVGYSFTFIWGKDCIFVFDPHSYYGEVSCLVKYQNLKIKNFLNF